MENFDSYLRVSKSAFNGSGCLLFRLILLFCTTCLVKPQKIILPQDEVVETSGKHPEQLIEDLGGCGRYQIRVGVLSNCIKICICWSITSVVIGLKTPDFWCDSDANANVTLLAQLNNTDYDAKGACVSVDGTKCTQFKFDDSMRTFISEFDLVCDYSFAASTIMTIQSTGKLVGTLVGGHIADLIGRKLPFFISFPVAIVAELASLTANGWVAIAICRFFVGVAEGSFFTIVYTLFCEFTLARYRVWIVGFPSWVLEVSAFCLVAWLLPDWRYQSIACAMVGVPCMLTWWLIPESYRWYLAHGKTDKAEEVLGFISDCNKKPRVDPNLLEEIAKEEANKQDQHYTIVDVFRSKQLIRMTLLLGTVWFGMAFIDFGIYFGVRQLSGNVYLNMFLFNMVSVPSKAVALWTQNRFGRRVSSMVAFGAASLACVGIGVVQNIDTQVKGSVTNGLAMTTNLFIHVLWGTVQTMTVELYPTVVRHVHKDIAIERGRIHERNISLLTLFFFRNIGFGTMFVVGSVATMVAPQFEFLGDVQGVSGLLYIACAVTGFLALFALFWLPETMDAYMDDTISSSNNQHRPNQLLDMHETITPPDRHTDQSLHGCHDKDI